jgi:hypothetical protein
MKYFVDLAAQVRAIIMFDSVLLRPWLTDDHRFLGAWLSFEQAWILFVFVLRSCVTLIPKSYRDLLNQHDFVAWCCLRISQCRDMHNFFSTFAIVAGLNMGPVYRLKQAWAKLPTVTKVCPSCVFRPSPSSLVLALLHLAFVPAFIWIWLSSSIVDSSAHIVSQLLLFSVCLQEKYDALKKGLTDQSHNCRQYRKVSPQIKICRYCPSCLSSQSVVVVVACER